MLLYIIRHGDPDYKNDSLTPRGQCQAEALSRRLAANGIDEIYSSPLGRAMQTAQPTADVLRLNVHKEDWMSEDLTFCQLHVIDETGEKDWFFAGQNTKLLEGAFHSDWYRHAEAAGCLTAKAGYERIQTESDAFIEKLGYKRNGAVYKIHKPSDKRVAVFCHHGMGTAWLSHLLNIPPLIFWAGFNIGHSGVTIIDFENHENGLTAPRCLVLSDLGHIYEARLPMEYNNGIRI